MECRRRTEGSGCYAKPDGLPVAVGNPVPSSDRSDYSPIRHCYSKAHPATARRIVRFAVVFVFHGALKRSDRFCWRFVGELFIGQTTSRLENMSDFEFVAVTAICLGGEDFFAGISRHAYLQEQEAPFRTALPPGAVAPERL